MNIAAVLLLEQAAGLDLDAVQAVLAGRLVRVLRLGQRLFHPGLGCGRPVWVDDPHFDLGRHLEVRELRQPAIVDAALADAAEVITTPLPRDRPLWRACLLTGLAGDRAALILVVHHVLADGLGGLAVLAALADGGPPSAAPAACGAGVPSRWMLAADAWRQRAHGIRHPGRVVRVTVDGLRELGLRDGRPRLAPRTSLNAPTGPTRRVNTVLVPLAAVVEFAHQRGATVNDVMLTAIVGALAALLRARGEDPAELVVSVPVSARASASAGELGNRTGVAPMRLPTLADPHERLRRVVAISRRRRAAPAGASAAPMGVVFRALGHLGVFQAFIDRQRLVNTFVTNTRGPAHALAFAGHRVSGVIPVAVTSGNVGVTFAILSYAGQLAITLVADPDVVPDRQRLTDLLRTELERLIR